MAVVQQEGQWLGLLDTHNVVGWRLAGMETGWSAEPLWLPAPMPTKAEPAWSLEADSSSVSVVPPGLVLSPQIRLKQEGRGQGITFKRMT